MVHFRRLLFPIGIPETWGYRGETRRVDATGWSNGIPAPEHKSRTGYQAEEEEDIITTPLYQFGFQKRVGQPDGERRQMIEPFTSKTPLGRLGEQWFEQTKIN